MTCFLNGAIIPLSTATISPLDRGFLFGDGVYEVVPVYARRLFCWQRHLRRLMHSLAAVQISFAVEQLFAAAQQLIAAAKDDDLSLYIQITRGAAAVRKPAFPMPPPSPTVFMMTIARQQPTAQKRQNGVSCQTMEEFRWRRANIKATSLLGAVLAAQHAATHGDEEVILIRDGLVGEAATCNVFINAAGTLRTPPTDGSILPGISREITIELARAANISVVENNITRAELAAANEIWLTSSTREILPVTMLDGAPVGDGVPGEMYTAVYDDFCRFIAGGGE